MDDDRRLEEARCQREIERAADRSRAQHSHLRAIGRESRTSYGNDLFAHHGEKVTCGIDLFLGKMIERPTAAGPHYRVWPLLLHFCGQGPRGIAVIALTAVIDRISRVEEKAVLGKIIGRALQDELNAMAVKDAKGHTLLGLVRRHYGRKIASEEVMKQLEVPVMDWTDAERRDLGLLVLELIEKSTNLVETYGPRRDLVKATEEVQALIKAKPPRPFPARRLPRLTEPGGWQEIKRNGEDLVRCRYRGDRSHLTEDSLKGAKEVLTILEKQEIEVDPWMLEVQKEAWECELPLFNVCGAEESAEPWNVVQRRKRLKIQETLDQSTPVAGRGVFLEHYCDNRGRVYSHGRYVGHQGPDHMKALASFRRKGPVSAKAFEAMLAAAAGHFDQGHSKWSERVQWGRNNLALMAAIAERPLDLMDQWKDAKDPWQFLQLARAVAGQMKDGSALSGVPIRYDQTCSGLGIIGMLTRDAELCRLTNCIGTTRKDIYQAVADDLSLLIEKDLHDVDMELSQHAEKWLAIGIDRKLVKPPIVASIYGSRLHGTCNYLTDFLKQREPGAELENWEQEYTWPAIYLARRLHLVMHAKLRSALEIEKWFRESSRKTVRTQHFFRWTSPSGFPLSFGREQDVKQKFQTVVNGTGQWARHDSGVIPGELSARKTNQGIVANAIHSFDAAFCQIVVARMGLKDAPVLTNHDCFATTPEYARGMHDLLHTELRNTFTVDWLSEIRLEASSASGIRLSDPPDRGTLQVGKIGENPYCFS